MNESALFNLGLLLMNLFWRCCFMNLIWG